MCYDWKQYNSFKSYIANKMTNYSKTVVCRYANLAYKIVSIVFSGPYTAFNYNI